MASSVDRREKLSNAMDSFDDAEANPLEHPPCVTEIHTLHPKPSDALKQVINLAGDRDSSLKPSAKPKTSAMRKAHKDDPGFNLDGMTPIVGLGDPDSCEGASLLKFGIN